MSSRPRSRKGFPRTYLLVGTLALAVFLVGCGEKDPGREAKTVDPRTTGPMPVTMDPERLDRVGEQNCRECHAEAFEAWSRSDHAHANRPINPLLDRPAFTPPREIVEGDTTYRMEWQDENPVMIVKNEDGEQRYPLEGVLAYEPLRQYLVPFPGGSWQTTTAAYDPKEDEWFDTFEGEGRRFGEWGHWSGQGLNWNANCAYCHNTEFEKNITPTTGEYHSSWTRQAISCVQCHSGVAEHAGTATETNGGTLPRRLSQVQVQESCATCHSRRDQLTADKFKAGDSYHDHFSLSLPTRPGLYYADGQIRDEVFVYGSFEMSRMGHAGISCMDCHDPHSMELSRPVANNAACTWCHDGGLDGAPVIEPLAHSHHPQDSLGNRCVECHMPKTTYMQRDPRADHGFLSPDPKMTRELGIPNACNKCHTEESVQWAEETVTEWYPEEKVLARQRERARAIHGAWEGDPAVIEKLMELARNEPIPAWRATYTGLLSNFARDPGVSALLAEQMKDPSSLVRMEAASASFAIASSLPDFDQLLDDPNRNVRIAAARVFATIGEPINSPKAEEDWENYLLFNSDRPQQTLMLAEKAIEDGDPTKAEVWLQRAIALEATNPELLRQVAILFSRMGETDKAARMLMDAYALAPDQAIFPYSLALIRAEEGNLQGTIQLLRIATRLDPEFDRAWYNLALALLRDGKPAEAREALDRATGLRGTPEWLRASQSINQALRR